MKPFTALLTIASLSLLLHHGAAVTCGQVEAALIPCISYLTGRGRGPSPPCCDGVRSVNGMAKTTADKRATCSCIKAAATRYADITDAAAQSLPAKCGIRLDIPVSRTVNCDKIN